MSFASDILDADVHINVNNGDHILYAFLTKITTECGSGDISFTGKIPSKNVNNMYDKYACQAVEVPSYDCGREQKPYTNQPTIMKDSIFYMNWMENSSSPTHCFTDKADAEKEAARLAHAHQRSVYTLQAIARTEPQVNVTKTELKEKLIEAPKE